MASAAGGSSEIIAETVVASRARSFSHSNVHHTQKVSRVANGAEWRTGKAKRRPVVALVRLLGVWRRLYIVTAPTITG